MSNKPGYGVRQQKGASNAPFCWWLMNVAFLIQMSPLRSPGFSRIRFSGQDAAVPAGISPAEAGTPVRRSSAGSGFPGRIPRPRQAFHRLKPGLPEAYSDYFRPENSDQQRRPDYGAVLSGGSWGTHSSASLPDRKATNSPSSDHP